jgi:hypothetical protein
MDDQTKAEIRAMLDEVVEDLSKQLATMHAAMMNLITALRATQLSNAQRLAVDAGLAQLQDSQKHFFATYGDQIGGANPQNN